MSLEVARSYTESINAAKEAERKGEPEKAAALYERAIRLEPHDENAYRRLMIIYRKLYRYEDELRLINKGIKTFTVLHEKKTKKLLSKNLAAARLSRTLAKSLGLADAKGKEKNLPPPIPAWQKRREVVEKKLGPTSKKAVKKKAALLVKKSINKEKLSEPAKKAAAKKGKRS